jgi:hypothetical protein
LVFSVGEGVDARFSCSDDALSLEACCELSPGVVVVAGVARGTRIARSAF